MGNEQSGPRPYSIKNNKDQALILFKAGKIVNQLKLTTTDRQYRQQQHLFARTEVYGHGHLIQHLIKLPRQAQFNFMRYLRQIDFETMDLLYQNYIHSRMMIKKQKQPLQKYEKISYIDKKQQKQSFSEKYKGEVAMGQNVLRQKKVAFVLFVGGSSTRFNQQEKPKQYYHLKQLYTQKPTQKSLLEIKLDKLQQICKQYGEQHVYIIQNQKNNLKINKILSNYTEFKPKKVLQNQNWVLSLSGKLCLKNQDDHYLFQAPSGCGDFINCQIKNNKILDDMKKECKAQYICCLGIQNILDNVIDPYLLGYIHNRKDLGVVYKCTYPESESESAPRILYNKEKKRIEIKPTESFLQNCHRESVQTIKRSPIWTNSCIIRLQALEKSLAQRMAKVSEIKQIDQVYTVKKVKKTYYNPVEQNFQQNQYCYIFQRELSDVLMGSNIKMQGVMVSREEEYMPVVSREGEKIWRDAYQEYLYQEKKKQERKKQEQSQNGRRKKAKGIEFVKIESKGGDIDPHQKTRVDNSAQNGIIDYRQDSLVSLDQMPDEEQQF